MVWITLHASIWVHHTHGLLAFIQLCIYNNNWINVAHFHLYFRVTWSSEMLAFWGTIKTSLRHYEFTKMHPSDWFYDWVLAPTSLKQSWHWLCWKQRFISTNQDLSGLKWGEYIGEPSLNQQVQSKAHWPSAVPFNGDLCNAEALPSRVNWLLRRQITHNVNSYFNRSFVISREICVNVIYTYMRLLKLQGRHIYDII